MPYAYKDARHRHAAGRRSPHAVLRRFFVSGAVAGRSAPGEDVHGAEDDNDRDVDQ
jgi:hypothetical protein